MARMTETLKLRFTNTESFMLFMEGLRGLQLFQDNHRHADLMDADVQFTLCAERYPKDALPLYYLGVVRALRAEVESESPTVTQTRQEAQVIFEQLVERAPRALADVAQIGRLSTSRTLDFSATAAPSASEAPRARRTGRIGRIGQWLDASLLFMSRDERATRLQLEIARIHQAVPQQFHWSESQRAEDDPHYPQLIEQLDTFARTLRRVTLREAARSDLTADLFNTRGRVFMAASEWAEAESQFRQALAIKRQWLPALRNLSRVLRYQERRDKLEEARELERQVQRLDALSRGMDNQSEERSE
jgi:hypothetical protein